MYCIKCGVNLSDTEKICPLCGTRVYHPDIVQEEGENLYPKGKYPKKQAKALGMPIFLSVAFLLPLLISMFCDMYLHQKITWSGYVIGALILAYIPIVLPLWFRKPNPVVFVPCTFVATGMYVWYVNYITGGEWFLSFAFPVCGFFGIIITTVTVLLRYVKKGMFYIVGGAFVATGIFMPVFEFLLSHTFRTVPFVGWSFYILIVLALIGLYLIFLGFCRPAREFVERKFFV